MGLCQQIAAMWPVEEQDTSQAVCMGESHGDPNAHCLNCAGVPEDSRCLYQVNVRAWPQFDPDMLWDPIYCGQSALTIWGIQGWSAWGAFTRGTYRAFLTGAPVDSASSGDSSSAAGPSDSGTGLPTPTSSVWPFVIAGAAVLILLGGRR